MKIAIAGTGYVGLSLAVLLSEKHEVFALDILDENTAVLEEHLQIEFNSYAQPRRSV